ncbi:MAG TPA: sugar transferase [Candidatus Saccharimonadales bacterium]|nr:sugar transferase [Candidatus Saccharimonadales bacterium]
MKNNLSLIYNVCLVVGDLLVLAAAFIVAYLVRVKFDVGINPTDIGPSNGRAFLGVFLAVLPFWIIIFALLGLYDSSIYEKRFKEFGRLLVGSFIGTLLAIFWDFMSGDNIFPARLVPIYGFVFGFLFLLVFRTLARSLKTWLFSYDIGVTRVLLVGNTQLTTELVEWLADSRRSGYQIVGIVGPKRLIGKKDIPAYSSFRQYLREGPHDLHGIIQTELYPEEIKNTEILAYAQEHHVSYRFVPGNAGLFVGNLEVELFRSSLPVITVHQTALFGWGRVAKRLFDLVFGTLFLILSLPIMAIICLIMLFDHGDPIWRNTRLGRFGGKIKIYKFRTQLHTYHRMTPEQGFAKMGRPDLAKQFRANGDFLENDPRISRLGRFLRRTSLDELPQLFNVIKGDMSLVGPRPLEPFELSNYEKKSLMLSVKTGLTGLAAVSGRRDISFEERRALDLYYAQNWSLWLDLVILAKTFRTVLAGRGAK